MSSTVRKCGSQMGAWPISILFWLVPIPILNAQPAKLSQVKEVLYPAMFCSFSKFRYSEKGYKKCPK